ncbi:hypothetical protein DKZ23_09470 [Limosilactobacillus reuteri]|uniref:Uncharacterized protein n=1 Tax=Limosilactobacillus reuteri TaxID=1598 RepID=A0A317GE87_LIMRT|nr:hypothetical protein [Limosilactobacillus reuteri]MCH5384723.1 hypothetical protein [Limosilactobacillus reuteri]PWT45631.1 hypothetical protein DKZ23_09470 [Limosilactobacillus reuteri]PWT48065.1 hypothetical protein DKZ33_09560 [Limosilactobacillus reuteri]PWT59771.1 hypothetical protein DKZ32_09475 [Limosilactobacillus reuteri]
MDKQDQKVFFEVLKAIDNDGKKRGLSQQQRSSEQLYYIAGMNYADSKPQMLTSRVQKYGKKDLSKIVGSTKANLFHNIIYKQSKMHKVDLSHMTITAAGALDKNVAIKGSQSLTTFPDKMRTMLSLLLSGKTLTDTHMLDPSVEQWLFTNGYYGDKIVDQNISKEDLHADLDVYSLVTQKGTIAQRLWKMYNTDPKALEMQRRHQEKGMAKRTEQTKNAKVGTIIVGASSLATLGLVAWSYARKKKLIEKAKKAKQVIPAGKNIVKGSKKFVKQVPFIAKMTNFSKKAINFAPRIVKRGITYAQKVIRRSVNTVRLIPQTLKYAYHHPVRATKRFVQRSVIRPIKRTYRAVKRTYHKVTNFIKRTGNKIRRFFRRRK